MANERKIKSILKSKPAIEGAGVHLKRAFGFSETPLFDPFLLLDDFSSDSPELYEMGFPWHPHRGIETITYVLSGQVNHGDSLGNSGLIGPGDVQWMTAGSGIIHQEMPCGNVKGHLEGFQLWANLPGEYKMTDPGYREIKAGDIPEVHIADCARIKIISGEFDGTRGPVTGIVISPSYYDVEVEPECSITIPTVPGHRVFAYVIRGDGVFSDEKDLFKYEVDMRIGRGKGGDLIQGDGTVILFHDGDSVSVKTGDRGVRFLLISGRPIGEPIAWYGPIVMNTREELKVAFDEFESGNFIKNDHA